MKQLQIIFIRVSSHSNFGLQLPMLKPKRATRKFTHIDNLTKHLMTLLQVSELNLHPQFQTFTRVTINNK